MSIIVKNGTVVTSENSFVADVKIDGEKISFIGDVSPKNEDSVIDASGMYILPGAVDVHTHLDLDTGVTKTADDFFTGTRAAVSGGTTTIIDFATQSKGHSLKDAVDEWQEKADVRGAFCDYGFHMAIVDWNDSISEEMKDMVDYGISSFKMYMAYKNLKVSDEDIYSALVRSVEVGGIIGFHCENGDLVSSICNKLITQGKTSPYFHPLSRPDTVEQEAIYRLCRIAELANSPVWVVHLSTEKGLNVIEQVKKDGVNVITETCPQYLLLDDRVYGEEDDQSFSGAKYVLSPPLRKRHDVDAMWRGINDGTIDFISTDHCSFNFSQKQLGANNFTNIPNGGPGIEHRVNLLYNFGVKKKNITINKLVELLSTSPSRNFGLINKGSIEIGKDADIVIFDPNGKNKITAETQFQNVDYTPYEGYELDGKIQSVFLRGEKIFENGAFLEEKPKGVFQKRNPFKLKK